MLYQTFNPHGGELYGRDVKLDFSVNTNPLGTPQAVIRAVEKAAGKLCEYPDPKCRALVRALAEYERVPERFILCGCGAAELIYGYCGAVRAERVLLTAPAFSEYERALLAAGKQVEYFRLEAAAGFAVTKRLPEELERTACQAVFLCNPNNPTGQLVGMDLMEEVSGICQRRGVRLFVDECFLELSDRGRDASANRWLEKFPGLFILKAFTKSYGMAGLRLGYCLSGDGALLEDMSRRVQPWNVSLPAQEAGTAALGERAFLEAARGLIQEERPKLAAELEKLGFAVCPSQANYLLLKSKMELCGPLLERGILIRDCSNYRGLGTGWYRVAVKRPEENRQLLEALTEIVRGCFQRPDDLC